MSFIDDVPNYKALSNDKAIMNCSPNRDFWNGLEGIVSRIVKDDKEDLKLILNTWSTIIPYKNTQNYGYTWLLNDLSEWIKEIRRKVENGSFHVLMDCLASLVENYEWRADLINEFLVNSNIGYACRTIPWSTAVKWHKIEADEEIERIQLTGEAVKKFSEQAYEEINTALHLLEKGKDDERSRKAAVRSLANAMESLVKKYGNDNDIKKAAKKLRDEKIWGCDDIVKQGDSIFNDLHRLLPDVRHGSNQISTLSYNEALYWIGRMRIYMEYMINMARELNRD